MIHIAFIILVLMIFLLRKSFSAYYFSPTGFLCITWMTFVFLMVIFANDYYFTLESSFYIFIFIFSFFIGEVISHVINKHRTKELKRIEITDTFKRNFETGLKIMGVVSLIGSMLYMITFANYFGGITQLLGAGWAVRGALIEGEIAVPFYIKLLLFPGYSNVILALAYTILFSKVRWFLIMPFIALFVMGFVQVGRAGFMLILFQVYIAVLFGIFYKNYISGKIIKKETNLITRSFILIFVILVVFVGGDMLRKQDFTFDISSVEVFRQYLFGGISAFNTFLEERGKANIEYGYGRYTFSALYDMLGISKNEFGVYLKYLRISSKEYTLTTNIFTAFRQYIDDFGVLGTCFFMLVFGFASNYYYNYAIKGHIKAICVSIVLYTILFHSTMLSVTVHNSILLTLVLPNVLINLFSSLKTKS